MSGLLGGVHPFLAVGHGLGEGMFPLLVEVAQGPVAGRQGFVPPRAGVVTGLAGSGGFGVRTDGAHGGVEGAEAGKSEFFADVAGCPGGFGGVGVADQPQPSVGHGWDVGGAGRAEGGERLMPGGPLVWGLATGFGADGVAGVIVSVHLAVGGDG